MSKGREQDKAVEEWDKRVLDCVKAANNEHQKFRDKGFGYYVPSDAVVLERCEKNPREWQD
jgi:hypothetical protein